MATESVLDALLLWRWRLALIELGVVQCSAGCTTKAIKGEPVVGIVHDRLGAHSFDVPVDLETVELEALDEALLGIAQRARQWLQDLRKA